MMLIRLDTLSEGTHHQDWGGQIDAVDLLYPELPVSVQVRANIHRLRDIITVRGQVRGHITRPCDRCLEPAEVALEGALYVVIRRCATEVAPEDGDDGEVLLTVALEEREIDLTDQIRDALVVEMPMAVYCRDTCKGLCPKCGANLNEGACACVPETDERWAVLKSLKRE